MASRKIEKASTSIFRAWPYSPKEASLGSVHQAIAADMISSGWGWSTQGFSSIYSFLVKHFPQSLADYGYVLPQPSPPSEYEGFPSITAEEEGRARFFRTVRNFGTVGGPRFGPAFWVYRRCLPAEALPEFDAILAGVKGCGESERQIRVYLKALGEYYKAMGDDASPYWRFFVNLETFGGYQLSDEGWADDVRDWVTGETGVTRDARWREDYLRGLKEFVRLEFSGENKDPDLDFFSFLADPRKWATSGSTHLRKPVKWSKRGRTGKLQFSKWVAALAHSTTELYEYAKRKSPQYNKVIKKRETGKVRAVVGGDDALYLKMAYFSSKFEKLATGTLTSLFMTSSQQVEMWGSIVNGIRNRSRVACPVDQSSFDHMVDMDMILDVLTVLEPFCTRTDEDTELFSAVRFAIQNGVVELKDGGRSGQIVIEKGVISGWRWTALIDSMVNYGEWFANNAAVQRRTGFSASNVVVQGDDDVMRVPNAATGVLLLDQYAQVGLKVNAAKNFIASTRDEYLRYVADKDGVRGYPARAVNSLLWRNPISADPPKGPWRVPEIVSSWLTLFSRTGREDYDLMLMDIVNATGINAQVLKTWLHTPVVFGGLGFTPLSTQGLVPKVRDVVDVVILEGQGALRDVARATGLSATKIAGKYLNLPKTKYHEGWLRVSGKPSRAFIVTERVPTVARSKRDLSWEEDLMFEEKVREKDWDWVRNVWLDPQQIGLFDLLYHKSSRRIFVDWLVGGLPGIVPATSLLNGVYTAAWAAEWSERVWATVVRKHKITKSVLMSVFLQGEIDWPNFLREQVAARGWDWGR